MKLFSCDHCGAEVLNKLPDRCICGKKDFTEHTKKDPDTEEQKSSAKYKEVLETLDEYEKGCEPQELKYAFEE